jgi:hypothetical protein
MRLGWRGVLGTFAVIAVASSALGCESDPTCSAEDHGLGSARKLTVRELPTAVAKPGPCATSRLDVLGSQAELDAAYADLGLSGDGVSVDFARERVILREGVPTQSIAWASAKEDTAVLGLVACLNATTSPSCIVNLVAVPALVTRVETRSCDPVRCGSPPPR